MRRGGAMPLPPAFENNSVIVISGGFGRGCRGRNVHGFPTTISKARSSSLAGSFIHVRFYLLTIRLSESDLSSR